MKTIATQSSPYAASSPASLGEREVEDDERREDEQEHRRQRVPAAQLDTQILPRERGHVGEVRHASASLPVCERLESGWIVGRDDECAPADEPRELPVEQRRAGLVERRVRLVEDEELRVVEQRPAERQPLRHPARVRRDALVAGLPEREALEQHPDPLAPLRNAVEPAEEVEVLERGELAIDERLVREIADARAVDVDGERRRASAARDQRGGAGTSSSRCRSAP